MLILIFIMLFMVLVGSILTGFEIRKTVKVNRQIIEHLQLTVVEMTRKQSDLSEKVHLVNDFKISSHSNFEKLNKEILEFCDLLMNESETQSPQDK